LKRRLLQIALLFFASGSLPASATNGYFTHGIGAVNKGMAGAGLASNQGSISIAGNPTSALFNAGQVEAGAALFSPRRSYTAGTSLANGNGGAFTIGADSLDSKRNYFVIPYVAYNHQLSDISALGIAFYGRGGMNTRWEGGSASFDPDGPGPSPTVTLPGTFGAGITGVNLSQAFLDLAYARRLNDKFSVGASVVVAFQGFETTGLATFAPYTGTFAASGGQTQPRQLTNNDHDLSHGFGVKLGFHWQATERLQLAAAYKSKMYMEEFKDYGDLFAESGDFDIPADIKLGMSYLATPTVTVSLDLEHAAYSDIASIGNPIASLFTCPTVNPQSTTLDGCLGGSNGAGFGWNDVTTSKIGVEWATSDKWTWRAGFSHGDQPVETSELLFNILAPGVIDSHFSAGFTHTSGNHSWNLAYTHAFKNDVSGANSFDPTQELSIEMYQNEVEFSYTWMLD
jgi:long-chain fatty acid transport protein